MVNWQNGVTPLNETNLLATNAEIAKRYNLDIGSAITSNSDLNSYTTVGAYYSNSTEITNSLTNCPITNAGFKLIVEYTTSSSRIVQTIKVNNANTSATYVRTYTGSWGDWVKVDSYITLYSSASGSTSGESLSKNISNFNAIEILYALEGYRKSIRIKTDGNSSVSAVLDAIFVGSTNMVVAAQDISISGTTFTRGNSAGKYINLSNNTISAMSSVTIKIFEIKGY